jgi:hypothetical protein
MLMPNAFRDLNQKYVMVYVDDVVIFSPDCDTHLKHLRNMSSNLLGDNLAPHPEKYKFVEKTFLCTLVT